MAAYDDLIAFITKQGVSEQEAAHAVRRCVIAMGRHGLAAYGSAGAIAYFLNMNPASAMGFATAAIGSGAAIGFASAPQCSEVRSAIAFWGTSPL